MLGATVDQIESAIGLVVAHYIPFRAIRAGQAAFRLEGGLGRISAEMAVLAMRRAMRGFVGPADIFRNPEAIFCLFEKPARARYQPVRSDAVHGGRRFRRDGHALQARAVRASIGRRDPRADGPAGQVSAAAGRSTSKLQRHARSRSTSRRSTSSATRPSAIRTPGKAPIIRWSTSSPRCCAKRSSNSRSGWQELMLVPDDYNDAQPASIR